MKRAPESIRFIRRLALAYIAFMCVSDSFRSGRYWGIGLGAFISLFALLIPTFYALFFQVKIYLSELMLLPAVVASPFLLISGHREVGLSMYVMLWTMALTILVGFTLGLSWANRLEFKNFFVRLLLIAFGILAFEALVFVSVSGIHRWPNSEFKVALIITGVGVYFESILPDTERAEANDPHA